MKWTRGTNIIPNSRKKLKFGKRSNDQSLNNSTTVIEQENNSLNNSKVSNHDDSEMASLTNNSFMNQSMASVGLEDSMTSDGLYE
jgi:hypothetical protein